MIVLKFGGTSVKDSVAMNQVINILKRKNDIKQLVVLSACSGITDKLLNLIKVSATGNLQIISDLLFEIEDHHQEIINKLIKSVERNKIATTDIKAIISDLKILCEGVSLLKETTLRTLDASVAFGEILSTTVLNYALLEAGLSCKWLDARQVMLTDNQYTNAYPNFEQIEINAKQYILNEFENVNLIITQGFIGTNDDGITTTLGRGGSDYSAAIFGAAINAEEIQIWTDVSGILTTDPRLIKDAKTVPIMTFEEVRDLAFFGAKVLHPDTLKPAIEKNIPVRVLNTFASDNIGTLIINKIEEKELNFKVKAITILSECDFINIETEFDKSIYLFNENLNLFLQNKIKYYYAGITDNKIKILSTRFNEKLIDELKKINSKIEIEKVGILCITGSIDNLNEGKQLFETINEYAPICILKGVTKTSIILVYKNEIAKSALEAIHKLI